MEMSVEENANKRWFVVHAYSGFEKSKTALEGGVGLPVAGRFILALDHHTAQTLLIRGEAGRPGTSLAFNGQTLSLERGEARFELPSARHPTDRLELTASGRVVIASAELI